MKTLLCLFTFLLSCISFAHEYQVKINNGVPQIEVDGQPVRARWFFGAPAISTHRIQVGEQRFTLTLEPCETGLARTTFHFRFGHHPLDILIDQFEVIDLTDGTHLLPLDEFDYSPEEFLKQWSFFPRDERNTVGKMQVVPKGGINDSAALRITQRDPADGKWPDFHCYTVPVPLDLKEGHKYQVRFWLKSDVVTRLNFGVYRPDPTAYVRRMLDAEENSVFHKQIKLAEAAGIDFITPYINMPWPEPGQETDWGAVDSLMEQIIRANPKANVVLRVTLYAPAWWLNANPNELMAWQEAKHDHPKRASISSLKWREEAAAHLVKFINHVEEKYPNNIAAYHPCAQATQEWYYVDAWGQDYHGYSEAETQAWRKWLRRKYASDAALQTAWKRQDVSLESAPVPTVQERENATVYGVLVIPNENRQVVDHNMFLQDEMSDALLHIVGTIRKTIGRKRLIVAFYGYGFEFSSMNRISACGHLALNKVLQSDALDILCSPFSYFDRLSGGGGLMMAPVESVMNAGKLWLCEDDTRTYLAEGMPLLGVNDYVHTLEESQNVLLRNTGEEIVRNLACWWMDLGRFGWYNDPNLWDVMRWLEKADMDKLRNPRPFTPSVAIVFDEFSPVFTKGANPVSAPLVSINRQNFAHAGVSYGQYLLDDVIRKKVPAKLLMMLNPWVMTAERRAALKASLEGKFVLWCSAPAVIDADNGVDLEASRQLTGFRLARNQGDVKVATATPDGKKLGMPDSWEAIEVWKQVPLVMSILPERGDKVLATWPDGSAAVVLRNTSAFCATPLMPPPVQQAIFRAAGIHIYTADQCTFYTDDHYAILHGASKEKKEITLSLPQKAYIYDALTDAPLTPAPVQQLTIPLGFGASRMLYWK